jgi:hypothetical protein
LRSLAIFIVIAQIEIYKNNEFKIIIVGNKPNWPINNYLVTTKILEFETFNNLNFQNPPVCHIKNSFIDDSKLTFTSLLHSF